MPKTLRSRKVRLSVIAGVLATATAAGLSIAGSAHAEEPSIQVKVCSTLTPKRLITVEGLNQNNVKSTWKHEEKVGEDQCVETTGWRWKKGQDLWVEGFYDNGVPDSPARTFGTCRVPADASDGHTCKV
jgi:hypothetical protein